MAKIRVSSSFARSIVFTLCLALCLSGLPFPASTQSQTPSPGVRTQGAPSPNLPDIEAVRSAQPKEVKIPPPTPAKRCRHHDKKCKDLKEKKAVNRFAPAGDFFKSLIAQNRIQVSGQSFDWRSDKTGLLPELDFFFGDSRRDVSDSGFGGEMETDEQNRQQLPHSFASSLVPVTAAQFLSFETMRMDPNNRTGAPGEDLFSGNYNWSLPLVSLAGRSGHDLNLTLSYNSLVWLKSGSLMRFDPDLGWPGPGFRLGFPTFFGPYTNSLTNRISYQVITPSGSVIELRQVNSTTWDAEDSSYTRLTLNTSGDYVLTTADGTQYIYGQDLIIKDRNGNLITVTYNSENGQIGTITDTLGRVLTFNYGEFFELQTIKQTWNGGPDKTLATFHYADETIYTNFQGMFLENVTYGQTIPVLSHIDLPDGSRYKFQYNTYLQVNKIEHYGGLTFLRSWQSYNLPTSHLSGAQTDCPRFTQRTDMAYDWNNGVATNFCFSDPNHPTKPCAWELNHPWGQVTAPDGTTQKQIFATTGWQRGLPTQTETWASGVKKKWTTLQWEQACVGTFYPCNPRIPEANVYDDTDGNGIADNQRRTTTTFTTYNLPVDVSEYDANATTVLRRTHTDYNLTSTYTNRRIIGLPSASFLYNGANTLFSKVEYVYDESGYLQATSATPTQHDSTNYGVGFLAGRANQTTVRRYDVTNQTSVEWKTGYNITGSPTFSRDPRYSTTNAQTTISYTDAWVNVYGTDTPTLNTFAYPTTVTDMDGYSSTMKYDFNWGAARFVTDPKGAVTMHEYEVAGRRWKTTSGYGSSSPFYTSLNFDSQGNWVKSYSSIELGQPDFYSITTFDGHGRVRATVSDHPGSSGQYRGVYNGYDTMGRLTQVSNPTEINSVWNPVGDDSAGWAWS
ncbi:MAG: hypothetical protein SF097_27605, partial [Acidobacteriota bacterium]|nr:hypothetical protein [Acidobacteriota bacterium]